MAILTGHLLKDSHTVMEFHSKRSKSRNPPLEIEALVSAVEKLLR